MSKDEKVSSFALDDDPELIINDNEVFDIDDETMLSNKPTDDQWVEELRVVLERGCDLGSIRSIGKCRPLTNDLRLPVWKV